MREKLKVFLLLIGILINFFVIFRYKKVFLLDFAPRYGGAIMFLEGNFIESFYTESREGKSSSLYFLRRLKEKGYELNWTNPFGYFPLTVFLYIPFIFLNLKISGVIFLFISTFIFLYSLHLLIKKERIKIDFLIFIALLLISTPFRQCLLTANSEFLSVSFLILSIYTSPLPAAFLLSISIFLKPHSIFFIFYFLLRDFRKFLYTILFLLLGLDLSFYIFGKDIIYLYFYSVNSVIKTSTNYATLYNLFHILFKENFKIFYYITLFLFLSLTLILLYRKRSEKFVETGIFIVLSLLFLPLFQFYYFLRFFPYYLLIFKNNMNNFKYLLLTFICIIFLLPFNISRYIVFIYPLTFFIIFILSFLYIFKYGTKKNSNTNQR